MKILDSGLVEAAPRLPSAIAHYNLHVEQCVRCNPSEGLYCPLGAQRLRALAQQACNSIIRT